MSAAVLERPRPVKARQSKRELFKLMVPVDAAILVAHGCDKAPSFDGTVYDAQGLTDSDRVAIGCAIIDHVCQTSGPAWYWFAEETRKSLARRWPGEFQVSVYDVYDKPLWNGTNRRTK